MLATVQPLERPSQNGSRRDPDRARRSSGCRRSNALQRQRPVHEHRHHLHHAERRNVTRRETPYLPVAAVQKQRTISCPFSTDATARRIALKEEIARQPPRSERNDRRRGSEVDRVLIGLSSALNNTDYEINQATASALVQDVANRNDAQRQIEAKKEQQHAESLPKPCRNTARRSA